jgi:hypothetical protein
MYLHFFRPRRSEADRLPMAGIHSAGGGTQFRRPVRAARSRSGTAVGSSPPLPKDHLCHPETPHDPQRDQRDPHRDGGAAGIRLVERTGISARKRAITADLNLIGVDSNSPLARISHRTGKHGAIHHMGPCRPSISSRVRLGNSRPTSELANPMTPVKKGYATAVAGHSGARPAPDVGGRADPKRVFSGVGEDEPVNCEATSRRTDFARPRGPATRRPHRSERP